MPVIVTLPKAERDLMEIWACIAADSEARADAFVEAIDRKFQALAGNPDMGRTRDELSKGVRSFPVGRYIIFYRSLSDGIEVVRVLHGARDLESRFHSGSED